MQMRPLVAALCGSVATLSLILACGDDSPSAVDASTDGPPPQCNCPAAEPPLEGRIMRFTNRAVLTAPGGNTGVGCGGPVGSVMLGGSCRVEDRADTGVQLKESAIRDDDPNAWSCFYSKSSDTPNAIIAEAICLVPPAGT